MKNLQYIYYIFFFAGIYSSASAQNSMLNSSEDSVHDYLSVEIANELFLFKNNAEIISAGFSANFGTSDEVCQVSRQSPVVAPDDGSQLFTRRKMEKPVVLERVK